MIKLTKTEGGHYNEENDWFICKNAFIGLVLSLLIVPSLVLSINAVSSNGEDLDWNGRLAPGAGRNINYWISSSNEYYRSIPNAVNRVIYPPGLSNNLVLSKTSVNQQSNLDFYQTYKTSGATVASTTSWKKNSSGQYYQMYVYEKDLGNWVYAEITLNDYYMDGYTFAKRETIIAHEILHALGLKDVYKSSNKHLMMYGYAEGIPNSGKNLSNIENNIIKAKY